ncbi:MAG: AbrB/MazE/SpoVT family DNA-binding domain-containing protein [Candidatus Nanopelagicales bacterium]|jgi:bifunctional DNA-binding transcriptional regulator/antitoxin component of YhaV-PrlF toxin-antitoxin module
MSESLAHHVTLGDRGRFVIPSQVRERHGWDQGTPLVSVDTDSGLLVMSAKVALELLRSKLSGRDLVADLLDDRRAEVRKESS